MPNSELNRYFCLLGLLQDFQLGFTFSSEAQKCLHQIARSAIEGAVLTALIVAGLHWKLDPMMGGPAVTGMLAAYAASTLSVAILAVARWRKVEFSGFLKAYGAGVFIRGGGLALLIISSVGMPLRFQSALLAAYALGVLILLLVEYRQFAGQTG